LPKPIACILNQKQPTMRKSLLVFAALLLSLFAAAQQNHWNRESESALQKDVFAKKQRPSEFLVFRLQEKAMEAHLRNAPSEKTTSAKRSGFFLTVPDEKGNPIQFKVVEASVMQPGLQSKHTRLRSYVGTSVMDPRTSIRFSFTPQGFNGVIFSFSKPALYIEKLEKGSNLYIVVPQTALPDLENFECTTTSNTSTGLKSKVSISSSSFGTLNANTGDLRVFRLAFAAQGEFSEWCLDGTEANDAERIEKVLAEQVSQITIVNGHIERDFGARMLMIDNNEDVIFLDPDTDPFIGTETDEINAEAQTVITDEIGSDNFDVGHLIRRRTSGSGGNAGAIGSICNDATKARGFTGRTDWHEIGVYSEIMLTHEFGHQFGANHTFTHKDESHTAQVEPGSGSTIMSYGGNGDSEGYHVVTVRDHYFHAMSIQQVTAYLATVTCGTTQSAGNTAPTADAGNNFTIPKSTPFQLTGSASDAEKDNLTHAWEQMDVVIDEDDFPWEPNPTHTFGPEFRSRPPVISTARIFPILENILDGTNTNRWEKLPSVSRSLNFRFTVRDNHPGAGQTNSDNMVVTIDDAYGPFTVTSPNSAVTWCPGTRTVTWDVNGSDELAENVKISLSTDGGQTFSTLLASTPNDGSADVTIACGYSTTARIKVEAVGNIFFDISNTNFTIGDNQPPTFTVPADITIEKDANCNYNAAVGVTGDVTDEADNCSTSLNATYADVIKAGSCVGETIIERTWTLIDGCNLKTEKLQTITIKDVTAPTFTKPADITIYKDENCNHNDDPSVTGNPTDVADNCDPTPDVTYSDVDAPGSCMGEVIITRTWKVTDDCGNKTEKVQIITVKDTIPPTISNINADPAYLWPPNHKMVQVTISYDVADNCSDLAHITKQLSIVSNEPINGLGDGDTEPIDYEVVGTDAHTVRLRAERAGNGDGRIYTIYITATDDCGNSTTDSAKVYVVHNITGPNSGKPFKIGSTVTMNGEFWDVPGKKHTAKWILDESTGITASVTEPAGTRKGLVAGSYKFNTAGVYKVKMSITDQNGVNSYATTNGDQEQIIVIYDPEGGHTFGGGWYQSPAGALKGDASATGKATFGFAANYFKKSTNPKGETQFVFKVGDFEYNAVNFEYLALNNNTAQIKGNGRITGLQSGISFIMTVLDGALTGGEDKIRMKIYNKNTGEVYYDNQPGASDADLPTMKVGANSTIVVQGKPTNREEDIPVTIAANKLDARPMPNPTSTYFTLHVTGNNEEKINVTVFDLYGRMMETHVTPNGSYIRFGENYQAGTYFVRVSQGELSKQVKLIKTN
jgi:hypothetical protein